MTQHLEPIRQDAHGFSNARSSSSNWFPLGRWIVDFENERGRRIHIEVINISPSRLRVEIAGPTSKHTNRITRTEAVALHNALGAALAKQVTS